MPSRTLTAGDPPRPSADTPGTAALVHAQDPQPGLLGPALTLVLGVEPRPARPGPALAPRPPGPHPRPGLAAPAAAARPAPPSALRSRSGRGQRRHPGSLGPPGSPARTAAATWRRTLPRRRTDGRTDGRAAALGSGSGRSSATAGGQPRHLPPGAVTQPGASRQGRRAAGARLPPGAVTQRGATRLGCRGRRAVGAHLPPGALARGDRSCDRCGGDRCAGGAAAEQRGRRRFPQVVTPAGAPPPLRAVSSAHRVPVLPSADTAGGQ